SEDVGGGVKDRCVPGGHQVELGAGARQLVPEEVCGSGTFALVEGTLASVCGHELFQPDPGHDHVPDRLQVGRGVGQGGVGDAVGPGRGGRFGNPVQCGLQQIGELGLGPPEGAGAFHAFLHGPHQQIQSCTVVDDRFTAQQVQSLDAVGALVDRVEPVVTVVLLHVVLTRVPVTTVYLDGQTVGLETPLGGPALDDRGERVQQQVGTPTLLLALVGGAVVDQPGAVQHQRHGPLDVA